MYYICADKQSTYCKIKVFQHKKCFLCLIAAPVGSGAYAGFRRGGKGGFGKRKPCRAEKQDCDGKPWQSTAVIHFRTFISFYKLNLIIPYNNKYVNIPYLCLTYIANQLIIFFVYTNLNQGAPYDLSQLKK